LRHVWWGCFRDSHWLRDSGIGHGTARYLECLHRWRKPRRELDGGNSRTGQRSGDMDAPRHYGQNSGPRRLVGEQVGSIVEWGLAGNSYRQYARVLRNVDQRCIALAGGEPWCDDRGRVACRCYGDVEGRDVLGFVVDPRIEVTLCTQGKMAGTTGLEPAQRTGA